MDITFFFFHAYGSIVERLCWTMHESIKDPLCRYFDRVIDDHIRPTLTYFHDIKDMQERILYNVRYERNGEVLAVVKEEHMYHLGEGVEKQLLEKGLVMEDGDNVYVDVVGFRVIVRHGKQVFDKIVASKVLSGPMIAMIANDYVDLYDDTKEEEPEKILVAIDGKDPIAMKLNRVAEDLDVSMVKPYQTVTIAFIHRKKGGEGSPKRIKCD